MAGKRISWLLLGVLPLMIGGLATGPSAAGPVSVQVNDNSEDAGKGDGTHDTQLNPDSTFSGPKIGFTGFDRYSGAPQSVGTAYTVNGGGTWFDNGNIAGGSNLLLGNVSTAWNPKTLRYVIATMNIFSGSGQFPIAVSDSDSWGVNWRPFTDTYTSIGPGIVARYPSLAINDEAASTHYGDLGLLWTEGTSNVLWGDYFYQSSTAGGTNWSNPVKVNDEATCPNVGRGDLVMAGDTMYAAYSCVEEDTYTPTVSVSTNNGLSWASASTGLPVDLSYSGEAASCGNTLVERTYYGDIGAFDFPRMVYDKPGDMLFLTTTDRGEGTDLSDIHVFGGMENGNPTWVPYGGLPGDEGTTYFAPEVAVNTVDKTKQLWYSGASVMPNGETYQVNTFVTTDLANWVMHDFNPSYPIPELKPNEDTAVSDCYFGHKLFDLDPMGGKMGLTFIGVGSGFRRPTGGTGVNPDVMFASLDAPSERTDTSMTLNIKKTDAKIKASGSITPAVPGGEVQVSLFKKKDGTFQIVGSPKTTTFDAAGAYKTSFNRPKRGTCRVIGDWNGDGDYAPASVTKTFPCKK